MQAAEAWEQGTSMFHLNPGDEVPTFQRERAPTEADVKRMIASNLETVEWIDWSKMQRQGERYSSQSAHLTACHLVLTLTALY